MIAVVRTGVLAGMVFCASLVAAPAFAAETPVMPSASAAISMPTSTAPTRTAPASTAPTSTAPVPIAQAPVAQASVAQAPVAQAIVVPATTAASLPHAAATIAVPASVAAPAVVRPVTASLHDLVISYIDRRDQDAEQQCLAHAVFFEARGETLEGQLAVAQVVLNRAASGTFPASICQVVTQPAQFSFVRGGRIPEADRSSDCWHKALAIADIARKRALAGEVASNVLWYHATYVSPRWGRQKTRFAQIGSHIFYS